MWEGLEQAEFVQYLQPVWRLSNTSLVGAEVLTRWQHPTRGLLLPEHFIGLAEESELIERIGERAIVGACEHLARLRRAGRSRVRLSINLSARQFRGGSLPAIFRRAIEASAVDVADLEVEITETMLMENIRETREVLEQLKDLGISIAIDDFGVGYSSLGYLKDLPIDVLKVDRSFVQRVETQREDAEIVAAIIAMAHKLHMQVVAEGIESETQRRFLCDNGCDLGQGFLFGAPQPYQTFAAMVPPHSFTAGAENTTTDWR
jgi:EAL domain-containing protein (putative c-di-GMP-specific phosphodiesterase class I)